MDLDYVTEELILVCLLESHPNNVATQALSDLAAPIDSIIEYATPEDNDDRPLSRGHIPFSSELRAALEGIQYEMADDSNDKVTTGHVLLALMQDNDSRTAQILFAFGITVEQVRSQVLRIAAGQAEA